MNSKHSMNRKFTIFITAALGLSIIVMGLIWIFYSRVAMEEQAERLYAIQVEMIGTAMKPAMMFNDQKMAEEMLAKLQINPDITAIHFHSADGTLLAGFPQHGSGIPENVIQRHGSLVEEGFLVMKRPVFHKGAQVGTIDVKFDLSELTGRQHADIVNIVFIMIAILFFTFAIVLRLLEQLKESEKNLYRAIRKAEKANQAKTEFLSTMSHELRTPIHGIIGLQRLIDDESENLTDEQRENLMLAQQSARSLQSLVNDILDLGKIESGNIELIEEEFDLRRVACEAMTPFRATTLKKGVLLSLDIDGVPERIQGDDMRLRQVLLNLIGNAVKFTDSGNVGLAISRKGKNLLFSVSDTGRGMEAGELKRIFDPFVQGHQSRDAEIKGTGLGTNIAKQLVELMGGTITVESRAGQGSRFQFEIPCHAVDNSTVEAHLNSSTGLFKYLNDSVRTKGDQADCSLKVLLAEDDPIARRIVLKQLGDIGIEVDAIGNGLEAWERLQKRNYDLLLTDIHMPGMSGIELTRKIRQKEEKSGARRVPIIGLSAHALDNVARECLETGMDHFMPKPVDPDRIISVVLNCASDSSDPDT